MKAPFLARYNGICPKCKIKIIKEKTIAVAIKDDINTKFYCLPCAKEISL